MKIKIILLVCLTIIIHSCKRASFADINNDEDEYKLYCYLLPTYANKRDSTTFKVIYKNFYITDIHTIMSLNKEVINGKIKDLYWSNDKYSLKLEKNGRFIDSAVMDSKNGAILHEGVEYEVDMDMLESYKSSFIPLESYQVNCVTVSNTMMFDEYFRNSTKGFIYHMYKQGMNQLISYKGVIKLERDTMFNLNFPMDSFRLGIEKQIHDDIKGTVEIKLYDFLLGGEEPNFVTILCKEDISNRIPANYKIISNYTDTIDYKIRTYGIAIDRIEYFFKNRNITGYLIEDLNNKNNW